jgi:hypothetical protein
MTRAFGVLEYWSIGMLEGGKPLNSNWICPFITPPLHYSRILPHEKETIETPSGGGSKPGPEDPDALL